MTYTTLEAIALSVRIPYISIRLIIQSVMLFWFWRITANLLTNERFVKVMISSDLFSKRATWRIPKSLKAYWQRGAISAGIDIIYSPRENFTSKVRLPSRVCLPVLEGSNAANGTNPFCLSGVGELKGESKKGQKRTYLYTLTCRPWMFHSGGFTSPSVHRAEYNSLRSIPSCAASLW